MRLPPRDLDEIEIRGSADWNQLADASIFVTGGTGFVGRWLVESFLWINRSRRLRSRMTVLSRNVQAFLRKAPHLAEDPALEMIEGDVRNLVPEMWGPRPPRFDFVIHAAADSSESLNRDDPIAMIDTIVEGTRRALGLARECGARRLLFISSGAVYGRQPPDVTLVTEEFTGAPDSLDPHSAYAEAKRLAELLCSCFAKRDRFETVVARPFAFVGPLLPLERHFAAGNFLRDALENRPIQIRGDGTSIRSYLYPTDMAIWLWALLFRGANSRSYNVGSEREFSILELARTIQSLFQPQPEIRVAQTPRLLAPVERYAPSTTRARSELGLEETIPLAEALRRTIEWHRSGDNLP